MRPFLAAIAVLALPPLALAAPALAMAAAHAAPLAAATMLVEHPWARPAPQGANGAGYVAVTNTGKAPDRLVAVTTPVAEHVDMHRSMVMNGVAMMHPVEGGLPIPAGTTAVFAPGGYHLMLVGLKQPLTVGASFPVTLKFQKAAPVTVQFKVETAAPAASMAGMHH